MNLGKVFRRESRQITLFQDFWRVGRLKLTQQCSFLPSIIKQLGGFQKKRVQCESRSLFLIPRSSFLYSHSPWDRGRGQPAGWTMEGQSHTRYHNLLQSIEWLCSLEPGHHPGTTLQPWTWSSSQNNSRNPGRPATDATKNHPVSGLG